MNATKVFRFQPLLEFPKGYMDEMTHIRYMHPAVVPFRDYGDNLFRINRSRNPAMTDEEPL